MANPLKPLLTRWGASLDKSCPYNVYPRPQLMRRDWTCLNGTWQYAIRENGQIEPAEYDGRIVVPFSPESLLSGVGRQLQPSETLWYKRDVLLNTVSSNQRLLLHFGAVDQRCVVYLNNRRVGEHEGGYWPFYFDITGLVHSGKNTIVVSVSDASDTGIEAYGKQKHERGGIWYTAQSGIWQTVWLERVPDVHIKSLKITPQYTESKVDFALTFSQPRIPAISVRILDGATVIAEGDFGCVEFSISLSNFKCWSPDNPFLYSVEITAGEDGVESYFGMREFGTSKDGGGHPRLTLNGKPIFHNGLLDQGYWSDGLYTAPSDEAMIWELSEIKQLGFNMLRKHIKIEPLRWYYHCDRLGILVWQDFVSGGGPYKRSVTAYLPFVGVRLNDTRGHKRFGRGNAAGKAVFMRDMERTVCLLYNTVSLAVWVPFNEGWGQFDSMNVTEKMRMLDSTRAIDHASGWHDQRCGDFASHHIYYKRYRIKPDPVGRIQALTEFGGYSLPSDGHMASDKLFGYRMYKSKHELSDAYAALYREEVIPAVKNGLSVAIYTQVSDVEDEINGLFTFDRAELKLDNETLRAINAELTGSL